MKKITLLISSLSFILLIIATTNVAVAQKIISGDLNFLKGTTSLNVVIDFTDMKIEKETEAEYIAREVEAKNAKEAGSGDKWKQDWQEGRDGKIREAFIKSMKTRVDIPLDDANATYTLIVYNINLFNKGWGNKFSGGRPAQMTVDYKFIETATNTVKCELREERAQYMSTLGTLSSKIQGCLEYCGPHMGKSVKKKL